MLFRHKYDHIKKIRLTAEKFVDRRVRGGYRVETPDTSSTRWCRVFPPDTVIPRITRSVLQEALPQLGCGNHAFVLLSEYIIPRAGDEVVDAVADEAGNEAKYTKPGHGATEVCRDK